MSLRLIDLREAALREYPEFGRVPQPVPWYRYGVWPLFSPGLILLSMMLTVIILVLAVLR
jgi:hypothetical protein